MNFVNHIIAACEYHRQAQTVSKSSFIVHSTSRTIIAMSSIRNQETGPSDFGDNLIINLAKILHARGTKLIYSSLQHFRRIVQVCHTVSNIDHSFEIVQYLRIEVIQIHQLPSEVVQP